MARAFWLRSLWHPAKDHVTPKACTAAACGKPTGEMPEGIGIKPAIATRGQRRNLPGGLPIMVDGQVIGGINVGSGTDAQDRQVAQAGLAMIGIV